MWWKSINPKSIVGPEYTRFKRLGHGLNGVVYRASQRASGDTVAIKFVNVGARDRITRKRLRAEIAAMQKLGGRCCVRLYGANLDSNPPFYVMEFLPLGDFRRRLSRKMGDVALLESFRRICLCVKACHEAKITHRDIKPENILFRSPNEPVLADFGVCKIETANLGTRRTEMERRGTPFYMAPEQLRNYLRQSKPADIWALGTMLRWDIVEDKLRNEKLRRDAVQIAEKCRADAAAQRPDIQAVTKEIEQLISLVPPLRAQRTEVGRFISIVESLIERLESQDPNLARKEGVYLRGMMLDSNKLAGEIGKYLTHEEWFLPEVPPYYEPHYDSEKKGLTPEEQKRSVLAEARHFHRYLQRYRRKLP
jgi:serine/threonine protein kinase